MRFISTKTHGILDYVIGILLIIAPWLFNFDNGGAAQWIPIILGIMVIAMALFTNYELGVVKTTSMTSHLNMDLIIGIFLAVSPWLLGFSSIVFLPHLLVGILTIATSVFTQKVPTHFKIKVQHA